MRPIDPLDPDPSVLSEAASCLRRGGVLILPTETVYGVAADPAQPSAMEKLYAAKGRDRDKPVALFVEDWKGVTTVVSEPPPAARALAESLFPGPLTLVLQNEQADGFTGFRIPDHPVALGIVRAFGAPLAVTSANRSGGTDPRTAGEAAAAIGPHVDLVIDGGPVTGGVPSTVVKVTGAGAEILRQGAIEEDVIRSIITGLYP